QAQLEKGRVEALSAAGAATQEELEQVRAAADSLAAGRDAASAQVAEAQRRLREARLLAPFSGIVTEVLKEAGEYVSAGTSVLELSGDGPLEVEIGVPEGLLPSLTVGSEAAIELPLASSRRLPGTLRSIGRAAGSGSLFPVVVRLEEGSDAAAGMTAEIVLVADGGSVTTVPLRSVLNPGGSRPVVFRLREENAEQVPVEIDRLIGDRVAVRSSLEPGDRVVTEGHFGLVDGDRVEVRP
ncbi:MAG: efflux RND transporter periplasmic adaptor subunit, partial [Acidobacteria bacterium]|nr:efflux RND transporter periplasmic adaptor subunit [Acidobacteriota bacterium]